MTYPDGLDVACLAPVLRGEVVGGGKVHDSTARVSPSDLVGDGDILVWDPFFLNVKYKK